jgi:hypothetical protein
MAVEMEDIGVETGHLRGSRGREIVMKTGTSLSPPLSLSIGNTCIISKEIGTVVPLLISETIRGTCKSEKVYVSKGNEDYWSKRGNHLDHVGYFASALITLIDDDM